RDWSSDVCSSDLAGDEPSVVVAKVLEGQANHGYNAATGAYGDLMEMGVIDPTKVTRTALQNAASVAGLILMTDATIAEAPKDESKAPAPATMGDEFCASSWT